MTADAIASSSKPMPRAGVADWTPYAQKLRDARVKGLIWVGEPESLAKLLGALGASSRMSRATRALLKDVAKLGLPRHFNYREPASMALLGAGPLAYPQGCHEDGEDGGERDRSLNAKPAETIRAQRTMGGG